MATREEIRSDLAVPPGEYLAEVLEELGMSQADLARRMGRPAQAINEIIKGTKALTPETAIQLEQVVGVPAHIWSSLEAEYRLVLAEQAEAEQIKEEISLVTAFPFKEMAALQCVAAVRKAEDKVRELRRFFGVASLNQLGRIPAYAPAFRVASAGRQPSAYGLAAWLHCGTMQAKKVEVAPFDERRLREALPRLRDLTMARADIVAQIQALLAECGVVFVLFPHFPKTYAHGATFWVERNTKAVVLSSIRGKWTDIFWFSLFHELGHLLLHGDSVFVEMSDGNGMRAPEEAEADAFAGEVLIPSNTYAQFRDEGDYRPAAVLTFAESIGIHPGIVVGRLQHDGLVPQNRLNDIRERYGWASGSA